LEKEKTKKYVDKFNIRAASLKTRHGVSSAVVISKSVLHAKIPRSGAEIIIFDEPTRGIDVNAKEKYTDT
jgi:ribose transport system ATP-binding protein